MSATLDAGGSNLGRQLAAVLTGKQPVGGQANRPADARPKPLELVSECEASWFVGSIGGDWRVGQTVCLGCGFGMTFVLQEQRRRPKFCGGCGEKIARYVRWDAGSV